MNAKRRKELKHAKDLLGNVLSIVENITDDESECLDNIPENLQSSQRYDDIENNVDKLEEAVEKLNEAIDILSEVS